MVVCKIRKVVSSNKSQSKVFSFGPILSISFNPICIHVDGNVPFGMNNTIPIKLNVRSKVKNIQTINKDVGFIFCVIYHQFHSKIDSICFVNLC